MGEKSWNAKEVKFPLLMLSSDRNVTVFNTSGEFRVAISFMKAGITQKKTFTHFACIELPKQDKDNGRE